MIKRLNLDDNIFLNIIGTEKFKSDSLVINIVRPLNRDEVTKNTLIPLVLKQASDLYPDNLSLQKKLEELYGAKLGANIMVRGDRHVIRFYIDFIDEKFVDQDNYLQDVLELISSVVLNPRLEDGGFVKAIVEQEKKNLKQKIEGKINDKRDYAIDRALEHMCLGESFSLSHIGYIEDLDEIDYKNLYQHYKKLMETSPIEIFYGGRNFEKVTDYFKKNLELNRNNIVAIERESISNQVEELKVITEEMEVNQAKLVLGYRSNIGYEEELYNALLLANVIFGGGPNSKLFLNVREKESLAYYIVSRLYKYKSIIMLDAGIEADKYEKTLEIIDCELEKVKNGDFTDEEILVAKKSIISSLNASRDSIDSLMEIGFGNLISDDKRSIDDKINDIEKIGRDEIIRAMNSVKLDTIYLMKDSTGEGEE